MEKEVFQLTPYMLKFFDNLNEIKQFVKQKADEKNDALLNEIYEKLHHILKEKNE